MIDLHAHSTASDGTLSPVALASHAEGLGLAAVALTDHDTVAGLPEFLCACRRHGLAGVPGVELSASWYGGSLHIVGLFINPAEDGLRMLLETVRGHRSERNRLMVERLAAVGAKITLEELDAEAGGAVAGRPHVASLLVRKRFCPDRKTAFDKWIGSNCPGYVRRRLPLPDEAIQAIHDSGGLAIMAHPFGNPKGVPVAKVRKTLRALCEWGLDGIEAYYSDHTGDETAAALALASEFGLLVSGGSDFHGGNMPGIELGSGRGSLHVPDILLERMTTVLKTTG